MAQELDPWDAANREAGITADAAKAEAVAMAKMLNPLLDDDDATDDGAAVEQLSAAALKVHAEIYGTESKRAAQLVLDELMTRVGEATPRPRIEPVKRLADLVGRPQDLYPVIMVAGTNGKTSTARMIEALLRAHGMRTGLFTSPHLVSFTERFCIDGEPVDGVQLATAWESMQLALEVVDAELEAQGQGRITFFEALAVLGYALFADAPVEVAVIEVGMGGEWDATNIATAEVAVVTPVALDHTGVLGDTIAEIAATKARIIKPESKAVFASQRSEAQAELQDFASQQNAEVVAAGAQYELLQNQVAVGGRLISVRLTDGQGDYTLEDLFVPLMGAHQGENAATALAAVAAFFAPRALDSETVEAAFAAVVSPGRLQVLTQNPTIIVDAAHNPHGTAALSQAFTENFAFSETTVVAGVLADKDATGVLTQLAQLGEQVILVPVDSPRTLDVTQLHSLVEASELAAHDNLWVAESTFDGLTAAYDWAAEDAGRGILVAGSVLLAGSAIAIAKEEGW
ncbi:bifunctional folylpolyglutamate synthase/dihydrofolate synthase [Canibacter zhoujuaniae]|uniref:bifunctional folylpolyglutamate synthase/dihydrofolate synthase n=1 Tax=Canibacter zhoujuaniae TaxID=2708343 RepID=UPI001FB9993F|nr:Mur ligase family protein [Canibacter zhoujuaniae]